MSVATWCPAPDTRARARLERHRSRSRAGEIQAAKKRRHQRALQGVCVKCGEHAEGESYLCREHADKQARYHRKWRGKDQVLRRERYENSWPGDVPHAVNISAGVGEIDEWHAFAKAFRMPFSAVVRTAMRSLIETTECFEPDWRKD